MTIWMLAAAALMLGGLVPAMVLAYRGTAPVRLVGLELAGALGTILMLVLCQALDQPSYLVVPLVLVLLSFAGTLVFTRLLGTGDG
ncbi:MAG TPA: monovalent cation/H+ antiporter complex subunit F [Pseudonocardiaceae bacterium]|jgi:multisubunit Na+/H+ antiporter MnhF subunit|nr:monovalent cation/H+ antiporter complex subunit F [Pseudonocardiaceae bacterium]